MLMKLVPPNILTKSHSNIIFKLDGNRSGRICPGRADIISTIKAMRFQNMRLGVEMSVGIGLLLE